MRIRKALHRLSAEMEPRAVSGLTAYPSFPGSKLAKRIWESQEGEVEFMSIIGWLLVGLIAGWLAGKVMGGHGFGILGDIVVGIIGSLIGGFVASALLGMDVGGFNLPTILVAFVGAVIFLFILRAIPGRQPFER
jgi:uncharacterized membrane protein YeaQ/YmgE (transglycosylase-associated protein family)